MKIILLRHGETDYNVAKLNQGWKPSKLTQKGINQAHSAGIWLKKEKIDKIYCSDLVRTKETAQEVLKSISARIEYVLWLREKNLGIFEGTPEGTIVNHVKEKNLDLLSFRPEGGETILEFRQRAIKSLELLISSSKDKTVLLITHGGVIAQLLLYLLKIDDKEYDKYKPPHCAITVINIDGNERHVDYVNITEHTDSIK